MGLILRLRLRLLRLLLLRLRWRRLLLLRLRWRRLLLLRLRWRRLLLLRLRWRRLLSRLSLGLRLLFLLLQLLLLRGRSHFRLGLGRLEAGDRRSGVDLPGGSVDDGDAVVVEGAGER